MVILTVLATLVFGTITFWIVSQSTHRSVSGSRFPIWWGDGIGEFICIPAFNGIAANQDIFNIPVSWPLLLLAAGIGLLLTAGFAVYRLSAQHNDWTRPRRWTFNAAGWHHLLLMFLEFGFIAWCIIALGSAWSLFAPLAIYATLIGVQIVWLLSTRRDSGG
jgi:hypothetical protein